MALRQRSPCLAVVLLVAGLSAGVEAQGRAVGQLLNVAGRVEVQRGKLVQKATLLFPLHPGDVLRVGDGGVAEVVLFGGGTRFRLSAPAAARVEAAALKALSGPPPQPLSAVSRSFARRMSAPARSVSSKILGVLVRTSEGATLGPRRPVPNGAVRGMPVTLKWAGPVEGDRLRLQVSDGEKTVYRVELPPAARAHAVPAGKLHPGQDYVWSVTAFQAGDAGARLRALVRVLLPAERAELELLERETAAARARAPDDPAPVLLLAQVYERLGLLDDAQAAYQDALRLRPEDEGVQAALKRLGPEG